MKYFFVSNSGDENIIGKIAPQCKGIPSIIKSGYKWFDEPNSMTKLSNETFPQFDPNLIFELDKRALLTDIVSHSNITAKGFLLNDKAKNIINQFNLIDHKFYPATLIVNGEILNYQWLHFKTDNDFLLGNINFTKSSFHLCDVTYTKIEDLDIHSFDDFQKKQKGLFLQYISASKLIVNDSIINKKYDLLYFGHMFLNCFISQRLVEALRANNITGFDFKEQLIY